MYDITPKGIKTTEGKNNKSIIQVALEKKEPLHDCLFEISAETTLLLTQVSMTNKFDQEYYEKVSLMKITASATVTLKTVTMKTESTKLFDVAMIEVTAGTLTFDDEINIHRD